MPFSSAVITDPSTVTSSLVTAVSSSAVTVNTMSSFSKYVSFSSEIVTVGASSSTEATIMVFVTVPLFPASS